MLIPVLNRISRAPPVGASIARGDLLRTGITEAQLGSLLDAGYVTADERTPARARRTPGRRPEPSFSRRVRLTAKGAARLGELVRSTEVPRQAPAAALDRPSWQARARELWWRGHLVKRFLRQASAQEVVLAVFQEEGWPPCIDDPLPPAPGVDPAQRVRETAKSLNLRHRVPGLRFHADGTGRGFRWEAGP